jgi:hypothetical protein
VITTVGFRLVNLLLVEAAAGVCTLSAVEAARQTTRDACRGEREASAIDQTRQQVVGQLCKHATTWAYAHAVD